MVADHPADSFVLNLNVNLGKTLLPTPGKNHKPTPAAVSGSGGTEAVSTQPTIINHQKIKKVNHPVMMGVLVAILIGGILNRVQVNAVTHLLGALHAAVGLLAVFRR